MCVNAQLELDQEKQVCANAQQEQVGEALG